MEEYDYLLIIETIIILFVLSVALLIGYILYVNHEREPYKTACTNDQSLWTKYSCTGKTDCITKCTNDLYAKGNVTG